MEIVCLKEQATIFWAQWGQAGQFSVFKQSHLTDLSLLLLFFFLKNINKSSLISQAVVLCNKLDSFHFYPVKDFFGLVSCTIQLYADSLWNFRMMKYAYSEKVHYLPSLFLEDTDNLVI